MFRRDLSLANHPGAGTSSQLVAWLAELPGFPIVARFETQEEQGLDLLFLYPAQRITLSDAGAAGPSFFSQIDTAVQDKACALSHADLPAAPGWVVLLSYELAQQQEPHLRQPAAPTAVPVAEAVYCGAVILRNRHSGQVSVLADEQAVGQALVSAIEAATSNPQASIAEPTAIFGPWQEDAPEAFLSAVERAKRYIAAGDIYQVNLSRRWQASVSEAWSPAKLAMPLQQALRLANPAPFSAMLLGEGWALVSASPERLLSVRDGVIETRPIAGTHPRGSEPVSDAELAKRLHAHPKERAEHVMLVDLERNDIGKLSLPGSVEVTELLGVEHHPTVHHLVSNIRGRLKPGVTAGQALAALFPGGTITGCPKLRAMQIIAELEGEGRGAYTGSLGYITCDGRMDFNILIRSLVLEPGRISFRAGAGIVADSVPETELAETRSKAQGLLRALAPFGGKPVV